MLNKHITEARPDDKIEEATENINSTEEHNDKAEEEETPDHDIDIGLSSKIEQLNITNYNCELCGAKYKVS